VSVPFSTRTDGYEVWDTRTRRDRREHVYVHQMVAIADGADPSDLFGGIHEVHHANGIPWDNRPENISVVTPASHAERHDDWTDAPWRDEATVRRALQSYTVAAAADAFGCSRETLRKWMRRHGIDRQTPGRKPDKNESKNHT